MSKPLTDLIQANKEKKDEENQSEKNVKEKIGKKNEKEDPQTKNT